MKTDNFITSYTIVLLALQKSPELTELIRQNSANSDDEELLSQEQIQEACLHPSAIIKQALEVYAMIQSSTMAYEHKIELIEKQNKDIEAALIKLKDLVEKQDDVATNQQNDLHKHMLELHDSKTQLELLAKKIEQEHANTEKIVLQHKEEWMQHQEKCFNELTAQLEKNGIVLTSEEKAELRKGSDNNSGIQEKLKVIEKFHIELDDNPSHFTIIACYAIISALSCTMQEINSKIVNNLIKKLKVIGDEDKASDKLRESHANQYDSIISNLKQLDESIDQIPIPFSETLDKLKKTSKDIKHVA